mgnify:CR=1 FL=1
MLFRSRKFPYRRFGLDKPLGLLRRRKVGGSGEEGAATVAVNSEDDGVILVFDFSKLKYGSRGCTVGVCGFQLKVSE